MFTQSMFTKSKLKRYLNPKAPFAILSWRYILPNQTPAVRLHRQAFLTNFTRRPRVLWCLLTVHSYFIWYLFYSWRQCYQVWKSKNTACLLSEGVNTWQLLGHLFTLAFLQATPPRFYYHYRLHRYPVKQWLEFIYTHELPHWHQIMSPNISEQSQQLLSDKSYFSQKILEKGLPAVPTFAHLSRGAKLTDDTLFQERSLFFKPQNGSRKVGCITLHYNSYAKEYCLEELDAKRIYGLNSIKASIKALNEQQDYLVQPLLVNCSWVNSHCNCSELLTVRVISGLIDSVPHCISAVLEIPIKGQLNRIHPMEIDVTTGQLNMLESRFRVHEEYCQHVRTLHKQLLPNWQEIKTVAEKAHLHCQDVTTVGWDLALTDKGIILLEGNFNWGVEVHQINRNNLMPYFQGYFSEL